MIRIVTLAIVLLVATLPVAAQEDGHGLHDLLTAETHDLCYTYGHNAEAMIPVLYNEAEIDSIYVILDFIDYECDGLSDALLSLRNLLDIERGAFDDPLCDDEFLNRVLSREQYLWEGGCIVLRKYAAPFRIRRASWEPSPFEQFKYDLASSLLETTDTTSREHLYCRHLLGDTDFIIDRLKLGLYPGTCLQEEYDRRLAQVKYDLDHGNCTHWSFGTGIWSPLNKAEILGHKIELSASIGLRFDRFLVDLAGSMRFLNSAEPYRVHSNGSIRTTEHFFSAYFGLEAGYELVRADRFGLDLHAGIGYDGIESYEKGDQDYESINSGNLNFGVTPRLFVNETRTRFLGLQFRYNIVKYGTGGGSDLSGNTLSLNLVYGSLLNQSAVNEAKRLRYYD